MSPPSRNERVAIWVAVIGALGAILAATTPGLIPPFYNWLRQGHPTKHVNGIVSDALTKVPMPGIVVQLETNEGRLLTQDTTDHDGKYNLQIPEDADGIRVLAAAGGYVPYDQKLPGQETRNDLRLVREHISIGIPDRFPLDGALSIVAGKLNITVVFATGCIQKSTTAPLNGGQLEGDPRVPDAILKDLLTRVKDSRRTYKVVTIEAGKRYEIGCS